MKKKQNGTKLKQKLTKYEWALLGVTALFLLFVFRARVPAGTTVSLPPSGGVSGPDEKPDIDAGGNPARNPDEYPGAGENAGKININTASARELETLPGVGPALAERIIAYRTEHGDFSDPEDLTDVPGIGPAKFAALKDLIVI